MLFLGLYTAVGLSVCAGYHRYFSHKSYESSSLVQIFYALFGAMAAQDSILKWSSNHRRHHVHAETEWDPYSITRGFWWAHIIWIFYSDDKLDFGNVRDLEKNRIIRWQHRWHVYVLIVLGLGLPTLIGAFFGDAFAGLLWGGFLRIVAIHHSTFSVNSLAHRFGTRTYDSEATARDNWMVALLTMGEGYHSFHHRFPSDFRNGVRWFHWDPAKWFIAALRWLGLASQLRQAHPVVIQNARKLAIVRELEAKLPTVRESIKAELLLQLQRVRSTCEQELAAWKALMHARKSGLDESVAAALHAYNDCLEQARIEWRSLITVRALASV